MSRSQPTSPLAASFFLEEVAELPLWEGDRIFLPLLRKRRDCFSLKLNYAPGGALLDYELTPEGE